MESPDPVFFCVNRQVPGRDEGDQVFIDNVMDELDVKGLEMVGKLFETVGHDFQ